MTVDDHDERYRKYGLGPYPDHNGVRWWGPPASHPTRLFPPFKFASVLGLSGSQVYALMRSGEIPTSMWSADWKSEELGWGRRCCYPTRGIAPSAAREFVRARYADDPARMSRALLAIAELERRHRAAVDGHERAVRAAAHLLERPRIILTGRPTVATRAPLVEIHVHPMPDLPEEHLGIVVAWPTGPGMTVIAIERNDRIARPYQRAALGQAVVASTEELASVGPATADWSRRRDGGWQVNIVLGWRDVRQ